MHGNFMVFPFWFKLVFARFARTIVFMIYLCSGLD